MKLDPRACRSESLTFRRWLPFAAYKQLHKIYTTRFISLFLQLDAQLEEFAQREEKLRTEISDLQEVRGVPNVVLACECVKRVHQVSQNGQRRPLGSAPRPAAETPKQFVESSRIIRCLCARRKGSQRAGTSVEYDTHRELRSPYCSIPWQT